ncbi:MAG: hypothetical protein ABIN48_08770 [Ginsengibacter sp.]
MEELLKKLQTQHGLSQDQSQGILNTITGFIKEKFPMVSGAIDNLFQSGTTPSGPGTTPADVNSPVDSSATDASASSKLEEFAKENFSSFFGNKK